LTRAGEIPTVTSDALTEFIIHTNSETLPPSTVLRIYTVVSVYTHIGYTVKMYVKCLRREQEQERSTVKN